MQANIVTNTDQFQEMLYTFAEFYKFPTKQFYDEISLGELDNFFSTLDIKTNFQSKVPSLQELQKEFMDCFSGIIHPFAPPVESVYKVWTDDPTAQVSIAKSVGYLMGDSALHMQHLLNKFAIEVPEGYENMPDHLTILLEFCAYLQANTDEKTVISFIKDHLDWLQSFQNELSKLSSGRFYGYVTTILIEVLIGYQNWLELRGE